MLNDHKIKISNYQTKFDKSHPPLPPLLPPPLPLLWPLKSLGDHSLREVRPGSRASDLCFCQMLGNPDRFSVPKTQRAQQSPAVEDPEVQESPYRNLLPTDIQEAFIKQFSCFHSISFELWVCVHAPMPAETKRRHWSPQTGATGDCWTAKHGCWDPNSGPPQD